MPLDRKRLLGHVETIQLILGVTDKSDYSIPVLKVIKDVLNMANSTDPDET